MDKNEYFNKLINNMFENLTKSIDCIETDGKSSIIYYFSALELLFKARLFKEHWAFILQDIDSKKATINNLKNGDFLTVSFDVAISRIQNLFQDLDTGYEIYFENLRNIRNRLIHFDCTDPNDRDFSIKNISQTWYYVYKLLNEKWKDMFAIHDSQINEINQKMQNYSEHFWSSKRNALINYDKNKYQTSSQYNIIKIYNKPIVCNYCQSSYDSKNNLNLMQMIYNNSTFTLIEKCDLCEHEYSVFLFPLYLKKTEGMNTLKTKFEQLIDQNLWKYNNSVNHSHYKLLLEATSNDINVNFDEIINSSFDDFDIDISSSGETASKITLKFCKDFSIESQFGCPAYYALYTKLIFTINIKKDNIKKTNFEELYNAIDNLQIEFFIDSDGF